MRTLVRLVGGARDFLLSGDDSTRSASLSRRSEDDVCSDSYTENSQLAKSVSKQRVGRAGKHIPLMSELVLVTFGARALLPMTTLESQSVDIATDREVEIGDVGCKGHRGGDSWYLSRPGRRRAFLGMRSQPLHVEAPR